MSFDVSKMLPHDHPMILIDQLITSDQTTAITQATIKNQYPFTSGIIGTWIGLELMAQSAAVLAKTLNTSNEKAKLGFLLGSRRFIAHVSEFIPGQVVSIAINLDPDSIGGPMVNANGAIKDASGNLLCEASLTLFEPNNDDLFLNL